MASKYANLPDIDTARDVYETEDIGPLLPREKGPDEEESTPGPPDTIIATDEIDGSRLPDRNEVGKFFRKAERHRSRKTVYTFPPSPGESRSPSPTDPESSTTRVPPLRARLRALQHELSALESELSDPSNPLLLEDADGTKVDTAEMLKGLLEVRGRLKGINGGYSGIQRQELVKRATSMGKSKAHIQARPVTPEKQIGSSGKSAAVAGEMKTLKDMDQRVAELEKLIGANNATIDEAHIDGSLDSAIQSSPLPPPLLPQINRLSNQITLLTQPRHIDSISRRLKLLLADLERHQNLTKGAKASTTRTSDVDDATAGAAVSASALPPDLAPILQRLSPLLPTIPHLLQRLRTLSSLHTSASSFASTLTSLEEDQKKVRAALGELDEAVGGVEKGLQDNVARTEGNLKGLETRIDLLLRKLADLGGAGSL
ncbi:hypothetical protein FRB96_008113 [Tulasnella sp. 330]|nr:hypothetical protein FRB96_008113 [Tulasnella sp. 330]